MRRIRFIGQRGWLPVALVLLLFFLPGCGSDDDGGTGPGDGGGDPGTLPDDGSELQAIGESGLQALAVGNLIVAQAGQWATGFGGVRKEGEPFWDALNKQWVWSFEEILLNTQTSSETRFWSITVQFLNGETPQESPVGADRVRGFVNLSYSLGNFVSEDFNTVMSVSLNSQVDVTGLGGLLLMVEVNGGGSVFAEYTRNGETSYFMSEAVDLHIEMDLVPGQCPDGFGDFTVDLTTFGWSYVGASTYHWRITNEVELASGTAELVCGE